MTKCAAISLKVVDKVWGSETWLVNEPEYCFKILEINKGAKGSLHYHPTKKETFLLMCGRVHLELGEEDIILSTNIKPITILPGVPHRITGLKQSVIFEVSTHHDDNDVVRLEISKA
jgi:mannose-6-phosphate isomerase-like protein (cupin superfamily)